MALQTNHTTDGFHCRPGIAGRQNNPLKYTDPSGYVERYAYWDGKSSGGGGHGSYPVTYDISQYFTMGGAGAIGPGSGKPWSEPNRSKFGNFMLMVSSTFDGFYGQGSYNRYLEENGFLGKNGHWETTYAELSEENDWVGFESDENSLQGINVTAEFVEKDDNSENNSFTAALTLAFARTSTGWIFAYAEPSWWGETAMGAITLGYTAYLVLNPNLEGKTTSRGNPTDWSFDPEINRLQNDKFSNNQGGPPPRWVWPYIAGAAAKQLYDNWPETDKLPTPAIDNTYIGPKPLDPTRYGY